MKNQKKTAKRPSASAAAAKVPTFKSFADAMRNGIDPRQVVPMFKSGKIRIEPFSRHIRGLAGSLKIGMVIENRLYDGAKSVTLTRSDVEKIYGLTMEKIA